MSGRFNPLAYWRQRGERYEANFVEDERYRAQETALLGVLAGLEFTSVLDVGCGFGRIAEVVLERWPSVLYTGIDLSAAQVAAARRRVPQAHFVRSTLRDFAPRRRWDVVLAVEFLMHVPPWQLPAAIAKLQALSRRHIITLDWDQPGQAEAHNWRHDYLRWFGPAVASVGTSGLYVA